MNATTLLTQLAQQGIKLTVEGETIKVSPKSRLTPQMINSLKQNKPAILLQLKEQEITQIQNDLMLLEAVVWSGLYEGANVEHLKTCLRQWFECADERALQPLLAYLEKPEVQTTLRVEAQCRS
jgi:hypothetical protein